MTEESRRFVSDLIWNDRNFMEAFTAGYSFINSDLAAVYKVSRPRAISIAWSSRTIARAPGFWDKPRC